MPSKSKAKSSTPKDTSQAAGQQNNSGTTKGVKPQATDASALKEPTSNNAAGQKSAPSNTKPQSPQPTPQPVLEDGANAASGINKKKQKRRMKEAAKRAATQPLDAKFNIHEHGDAAQLNGYDYGPSEYDGPEQYRHDDGADDAYYMDEANRTHAAEYGPAQPQTNGYTNHDYIYQETLASGKKKKKQKGGLSSQASHQTANALPLSTQGSFQRLPPPPPPPLSQSRSTSIKQAPGHGQKDRIWNTSTAEERERIKEFWLSLGEGDRRGLVRIEKEAVLKKMKEQQKHSCSCTVCGRKRTAIEEELEVLYDAYYEELETYANHQQFGLDASSMPPPRSYARSRPPLPPSQYNHPRGGQSSRGRVEELGTDDDAGDEEEYSDEDEDDDISEDEIDRPMGPAGGIFNFGNSLTAQDDLLKNDGKKFIEMMEQLAERRMQREEEAHLVASGMGHPSMRHGPPEQEDEGYDDEEDEEDFNSEEEDEFEDDEMEAMSEEQRMEEGRRMFQIFAARMFEQRVLTAYREKVSAERQRKLIEELAEDEQLDAQREAKKAKEAQKKRDKRQKQKQAKDEEKAKRDAEKAAEEAAARALEEKKAEEQRRKREEQRKKKEAEKKTAEEERKRKEEEKQRHIQERKEQQAELERRQREQKEREKKKRDEAKKKEREEREAKEQESREKREREAVERKEREANAQAENDAKERAKKEDAALKQAATAPKRQSPANAPSAAIPLPSSLLPPPTTSSHASPRLPVATPVLPKAPTPVRARQKSLQDSRTASPKLSQTATSSTASPATLVEQHNAAGAMHSRKVSQPGPIQLPQQQSRFSPVGATPGTISQPPGFAGMAPMASNGFPTTFGPPLSPMTQHAQHYPPGFSAPNNVSQSQYRPMQANTIPFPPGINTMRPVPLGQGGNIGPPMSKGPELAPLNTTSNNVGRFGMSHDSIPSYTHSRNVSASSNMSPRDPNPRPAPIQRPSSVNPHQQTENLRPSSRDMDNLSNHLGSSALLDDTDVALESAFDEARRGSMAMGASRASRQGFGAAPSLAPIGTSARTDNSQHSGNSSMWSTTPHTSFGPSGRAPQSFSSAPGFGRPINGNAFSSVGAANRSGAPRGLRIRMMVCSTCDKLTAINPNSQGWHVAEQVLQETKAMMPRNEPSVQIMEMLQFCDTEGNAQNGGGWFEFKGHDKAGFLLKHHTEANGAMNGSGGPPPGDIGSPIVGVGGSGGNNLPPIGGQASFQQPGGFTPSSGF
ncbi:MAG: hypothetical protein Q9217_003371 [Psora testacea]